MDPHTGLAVGLLRKRRPDWTIASHLKSLRNLLEDLHRFTERIFQPGVGRVSQEKYSMMDMENSLHSYITYPYANSHVSIQNDTYQIDAENKQISLWIRSCSNNNNNHTLYLKNPHVFYSKAMSFDSPKPTANNSYKVQGYEHLPLEFWAEFDLSPSRSPPPPPPFTPIPPSSSSTNKTHPRKLPNPSHPPPLPSLSIPTLQANPSPIPYPNLPFDIPTWSTSRSVSKRNGILRHQRTSVPPRLVNLYSGLEDVRTMTGS